MAQTSGTHKKPTHERCPGNAGRDQNPGSQAPIPSAELEGVEEPGEFSEHTALSVPERPLTLRRWPPTRSRGTGVQRGDMGSEAQVKAAGPLASLLKVTPAEVAPADASHTRGLSSHSLCVQGRALEDVTT